MLKKNKFKIISIYAIFDITYNLIKSFSQNATFIISYSLISALVLGFIFGGLLDHKSNKRSELKEINKNIHEFKKAAYSTLNNEDIISKLEKLNALKQNNSITEEEYMKLKNQLLNKN